MKKFANLKGALIIGVLLVVSAGFHGYHIARPAEPVFDEAHFATYAADYAGGRAFFDIHPPLGKLLYGGVIRLAAYHPERLPQFVEWQKIPGTDRSTIVKHEIPYGDFPFVWLRVVSALCGVALSFAVYRFAKNVGLGEAGALLVAFFVVFENAILLQTRLILLDGMYILFGFIALALAARRTPAFIAAGIFFGLSLSVKFVGIVFLPPILFLYFWRLERERSASLKKFFAAAALVFVAITAVHGAIFSVDSRLALWREYGFGRSISSHSTPSAAGEHSVFSALTRPLVAAVAENFIQASGNLDGTTSTLSSPWYRWPFMYGSFAYYPPGIALVGNYPLWFAGTAAVFMLLFFLIKNAKRARSARRSEEWRAPLVIAVGFVGALLPFFTIVRRSAFLYHYFPALIFSYLALAWGLTAALGVREGVPLTLKQKSVLALCVLIVLAGFLLSAHFVYGG